MPTAVICVVILIFVFRFVKYTQDVRKAKAQPAQPEGETLSEKDIHKMSGKGNGDGNPSDKPGFDPDELERLWTQLQAEKAQSDASDAPVPSPEVFQKAAGIGPEFPDKALAQRVVDYYTAMWNPTDGTLFTDPAMTIDHFSIQIDTDHLTDRVWLEGSNRPLTNDTTYSALPGQSEVVRVEPVQRTRLYLQVKDALLKLGTVTTRADLFFPVHPKGGNDATDAKADLQEQMEELLRQRKRSKGRESLA